MASIELAVPIWRRWLGQGRPCHDGRSKAHPNNPRDNRLENAFHATDRVYAAGSFTRQCSVTYCWRVGDKLSLN
jgi:hypothetical protein